MIRGNLHGCLMQRKNCIFLAISGFLLLASFFTIAAFSSTEDTGQPPSSVELSHVRVVRLSFMEGAVTLRRAGSTEWERAMLNSPIQEGFSLATGKKSFVEVEFENGSTVRLGELSGVDFSQLALTAQGGRINHLTLDQGYATFHVIPERHDEYTLSAAGVTVAPRGKAEFRSDLNQDRLRVEVFDGHVQASDSSQTENLGKNHALVRDISSSAPFQVTDKVQKDDWDKWTSARDQQSALAVNEEAMGINAPIYGWDDLDVYGEWSYFPGYGNGWAPYEPTGWSPYSAGMWDWYPSMGYTWTSAEPWGWLPFHYGFWNFSPGAGWFWMPGSFAGWSPAMVNWYSGPGWVGWTPVGIAGVGGRAPCTLAVAGCLTAMSPTALGNREPIRPENPHLLHPASIDGVTAITRPAVVSSPMTPARTSLSAVGNLSAGPGEQANGNRAPINGQLSASGFKRGPESAPSSIIMGREVSSEAFLGHHFASGTSSNGREPVRIRLGSALGGRFPMRNATGSSMDGSGSRGASVEASMRSGAPQILSRGSGGSASFSRGGVESRGGGGAAAMARSGGGFSGGAWGGSHGGGSSSGGSSGGGHH